MNEELKITVLKTLLLEDVVRQYGKEGLGPCAAMKEGAYSFEKIIDVYSLPVGAMSSSF
ncbi:MAG: hypothetical protein IJD59_05100 [Clostridia bacterium]|nr:hypothetical protein [Clostridia bacterium]